MPKKSDSKAKTRKARKRIARERVPGMARDATTTQTPSPGSAGSSNMMDRVLGPPRGGRAMMRSVMREITETRGSRPISQGAIFTDRPKQGKPIKSKRKT